MHSTLKAKLALITLALFILACGKRTPPTPPTRQNLLLSGYQKGSSIIISWQNKAEKAEVYRLVESIDSPSNLTEEDFRNRSSLIAVLRDSLTFEDKLLFTGQPVRIHYAVRLAVQGRLIRSTIFSIEPLVKVPLPPKSLVASVSQDKIVLRWSPPSGNIDGSKPVNLIGYNVYRVEGQDFKQLNRLPLQQEYFEDYFFEFERSYEYFVRSIAVNEEGELVESDDSDSVQLIPKDTFPPSPPEALTAAASPDSISIFFAVSRDKDVIGYVVFRSEDPSLPLEQWQRLTSDLLTTNTFQDNRVESGKTYFYYVKAVDKFGNISPPSEIVNEMVP